MKRILVKFANWIFGRYSIENMPSLYYYGEEYEIIAYESHPDREDEKGWLIIKAQRRGK